MSVAPPGGVHVSYRQQYRRCGKPSCTLCAGGGPGHGPYWYAAWQEGGRTRARYLGKALPTAAERHGAPAGHPIGGWIGLRVRTLGGFEVWRDGAALQDRSWARHRTGALFKWLLAAPDRRLSRDAAIEALWPEATPATGAANLRVLVHRLRRVLGEDPETPGGAIVFDGETLALLPGVRAEDWLDAAAFARDAARAMAGRDRAACRAALDRYTGEYLPDDPYDEWALGRRDELRQARSRLLLHLADLCRAAGEAEEAAGCLHAVLAEDRCHEAAAVALMRIHAEAGRPGAALRVYRQLVTALREELDLAPGRAAQALAAALRARQDAAPPAPAAPAAANNLPGVPTSFVGRGRELATLRALLGPGAPGAGLGGDDRPAPGGHLLTLVGPGGVGKTRLALALAEDLLEAYPGGIWFADLSGLPASPADDDAPVAHAVGAALGLREEPGRPLAAALIDSLRERRALLLLDNCEHVLPACAALVAALLPACPALRVLATSRDTLGVAGERPWFVPALSLPEGAEPGRLAEAEAVRLFLARARVQRPDLEITADNAAALASICRQLDGLPLALELAAARAGVLSLEGIAARLGESLRLLTGGPRGVPARQRTLRATLDWSYGLLGDAEQALLRRLAVFAGGCTLEAAEAVCGGEGLAADEVLDLLAGLVRQSLVQVDDAAGAVRYRLLETVRQYGWAQLATCGEVAVLEQRHAAYYVGLAEEAEPALTGASQAAWLARLETEHDNLRAVLRRAQERGEHQVGLRLAGAVWRLWYVRGHVSEGRRWLEGLLNQAGARAPSAGTSMVRAKALNGAGSLAFAQGDYDRAGANYGESLALFRDLGDKRAIALALNNLGDIAYVQDDLARAGANYEESLALGRELDDTRAIAISLYNLGDLAWARGDYARARTHHEESLVLRRALADKAGVAISLGNLGSVAREQGDCARALVLHEESLALKRELGDKRGIAYSLYNLGAVAFDLADRARAQANYEEGLALFRQLGDKQGIALSLRNLGGVALEQGDYARATALQEESLALFRQLGDKQDIAKGLEGMARLASAPGTAPAMQVRSARLLGAAAALREAIQNPLPPSEREGYERAVAAVRAAMSEATWAAAWAEGRALTLEQAIDLALAAQPAGRSPAGRGHCAAGQ